MGIAETLLMVPPSGGKAMPVDYLSTANQACTHNLFGGAANSRIDLALVLIETSGLLRDGLALTLQRTKFDVVHCASHLAERPFALDDRRAVLVIGACHDLDETLGQIAIFKQSRPDGLVVTLLDQDAVRPQDFAKMFEAGVNAWLCKSTSSEALVRTLELVSLQERPFAALMRPHSDMCSAPAPAQAEAQFGEHATVPRLTRQEKRILKEIVDGAPNKIIAYNCGMAEATVKVHVKAILRKIRVRNRTQAAIWALHNKGAFEEPTGLTPIAHASRVVSLAA
jgi:two-component system nitrate/nitrite response regulator NarL